MSKCTCTQQFKIQRHSNFSIWIKLKRGCCDIYNLLISTPPGATNDSVPTNTWNNATIL